MVDHHAWEYRILVVPAAKPEPLELNRLGMDGWELASVAGVGELGAVEELWCFLKRPSKSGTRA